MTDTIVRSAVSADIPALIAVARGSGLFTEDEMAFMEGSISGHFDAPQDGHRWTVLDRGGVAGAALIAPEMGEGVLNLLFIGLVPERRRNGGGSLLLRDAEAHGRAERARMLLVDTGGAPEFAPARAFYARHGYEEEARIRDYWRPGDDKVTFRKVL